MKLTELDKKRFWAKVQKGSEDECWEWQGALRVGYGAFKLNGDTLGAHCVAHFLATGDRPSMVCHHCDNRACCNPKHLYSGTRSSNMKDAFRRGRMKLPTQKLTPEQVFSILEEYEETPNCVTIAKRYGVDRRTIGRIVAGTSYGWLTGIQRGTKLKHPCYRNRT